MLTMVKLFGYRLFPFKKRSPRREPTFIGDDEPWYATLDLETNQVVNLDQQNLGDDGVTYVARRSQQCRVLYLSRNHIGRVGASALGAALEDQCCHLVVLCLSGNVIPACGVRPLAYALQSNSTLVELLLGSNAVGDVGARLLGHAVEVNTTLRRLDLGNNGIGNIGAQALATALQRNTTLQKLSLWGNRIGPRGAEALARSLGMSRCSLVELCLLGNRIGTVGACMLAQALETNGRLETLILADNGISDVASDAFALALLRNGTLKTLDMQGNMLSSQGMNTVAQCTQYNTSKVARYLLTAPVCSLSDLLEAMAYNSSLRFLKLEPQSS